MLGSRLAFNVAGPWFISFLSLILSLVTVLKDNAVVPDRRDFPFPYFCLREQLFRR